MLNEFINQMLGDFVEMSTWLWLESSHSVNIVTPVVCPRNVTRVIATIKSIIGI